MANYSLVAGPKYNPLDFDTTLKVLQLSQARHDELEEAYGELGAMSDTIGGRLDEKADPIAYARWKQYNDALNSAADNLSMYGLNPQSRRTLMDTRRYYGKQVAPIDLALQNRTKIQDEARKQLLNNPTWYTENDVLNASVDRWLENEGYDWGKQYSGAMLTQQVSTQLAPLAKVLRNYGKGIPVDKYTDTFLKQHGIDVPTAYRMMMEYQADPENVSPDNIIAQIVNNVVDTAVGPDWDESTREAARRNAFNYAQMGITSAIGQDEVQPIENFANRQSLLASLKDSTKDPTGAADGININPTWLIANNAGMDKKINTFKKYFRLDPKSNTYVLTNEGREILKEYEIHTGPGGTTRRELSVRAQALRDFVINDLEWKMDPRKGHENEVYDQPGEIGNAFTRYVNMSQGKTHDAYISTEYPIDYDKSDGAELARHLVSRTAVGLEIVEFEKRRGEDKPSFHHKGHLTSGEVEKEGYYVVTVNPSKYGITAILRNKDGNQVRVKVPQNANQNAFKNMSTHLGYADIGNSILTTGYNPQVDSNGNIVVDENGDIVYTNEQLTPYQRIHYEAQLQRALMGLYNATHSIVQINKSKPNNQAPTSQYTDYDALERQLLGM